MTNSIEPESADMGDPGRIPATTPDDVLDVFAERDDRAEPLTAPELADRLNCSRRTALNKLHDLEDRDDVASKKVGGRSKVWWRPIPRDQSPPASARESATESTPASGEESAGGASTSQPPGEGESRSERAHGGESDTGERDTLDGVLAELPGTVDPDAARDAILAARGYLEKHGQATKGDFVRGVMPDYPLGYDPDAALAKLESNDRYRGSWWRKVVKPGLAALDGVEKPPKGASDWKLAGSGRDA